MADVELSMAIHVIKPHVGEGTLVERLSRTFKWTREHERDIFWMSIANDDKLFRAALCAVMLESDEIDRERIVHAMKPLKTLSALMQGVNVQVDPNEFADCIPLMKLFHEAGVDHAH